MCVFGGSGTRCKRPGLVSLTRRRAVNRPERWGARGAGIMFARMCDVGRPRRRPQCLPRTNARPKMDERKTTRADEAAPRKMMAIAVAVVLAFFALPIAGVIL